MRTFLAVLAMMAAGSLAFAMEGEPIPGASVKVGRKPPGSSNTLATGVTDAQGSSTFEKLPDGTFYVLFQVGGTSYEVFESESGEPVRISSTVSSPYTIGPRTSRAAATPVVTTRSFGDVTVTIEVLGTTLKASIAKQTDRPTTTEK